MAQIQGLSPEDELMLLFSETREYFKPSRCPKCLSTDIFENECLDGSLCKMACGGGGFRIQCARCGTVIHESECEESEEK